MNKAVYVKGMHFYGALKDILLQQTSKVFILCKKKTGNLLFSFNIHFSTLNFHKMKLGEDLGRVSLDTYFI